MKGSHGGRSLKGINQTKNPRTTTQVISRVFGLMPHTEILKAPPGLMIHDEFLFGFL